jgi:hypothetical protein
MKHFLEVVNDVILLSNSWIWYYSRMALQKRGHRFMQQKNLKKLAH